MPIFKKEGNQLVEYTQPSQIAESLKPQGNTLFANLPTTPSQGDMYKVTDDFTTDNRFEEPNKEMKAPIFIYFNGTKWVLFASSGGDTHIIGTRNQCISWATQGMIPDGSVCIFTDDYDASTPYVVGTQAQINTMLNQGLLGDGTVCVVTDDYTEVLNLASNIGYDNTSSGLSSTRVQGAIDEINSDLSKLELSISTTTETYSITSTSQTAGYYYQNLGIPSEISSVNKIYSCMLISNTGVGTVVSVGVDIPSEYIQVRYTQAPNNGSVVLRFLYNAN